MPSESIYLPAEDERYVRRVRDSNDTLENKSQALQRIIREHREEVGADV